MLRPIKRAFREDARRHAAARMNGNGAHDHASLEAAVNVAAAWKYKSEGELNLVLSYLGDHAALRGKVLRSDFEGDI